MEYISCGTNPFMPMYTRTYLTPVMSVGVVGCVESCDGLLDAEVPEVVVEGLHHDPAEREHNQKRAHNQEQQDLPEEKIL